MSYINISCRGAGTFAIQTACQTFTFGLRFVGYNYLYISVLWKNTKAAMWSYSCTQTLDFPLSLVYCLQISPSYCMAKEILISVQFVLVL